MKVRVRAFAVYRELLGRDSLELELPDGATPRSAFEQLFRGRDDLARLLKSTMFAVNEEYVAPAAKLKDGDVLALIPPVAGGAGGGSAPRIEADGSPKGDRGRTGGAA